MENRATSSLPIFIRTAPAAECIRRNVASIVDDLEENEQQVGEKMATIEEQQLQKRFSELAEQSYQNNAYYFTDFLSPGDAALVYPVVEDTEFSMWGGAPGCERVILRFGNPEDLGYEIPFPVRLLKAEPLIKKFADELTHRDFLGALMNLGIERDTIGDIVVKDKIGYIFVVERIADYIQENLIQVKHTHVKCQTLEKMPEEVQPELEPVELIVSSVRMDGIISKLFRLSRNQSLELFRKKMILVNGRVFENNSGSPKEGDVVAVRGYGKFVFREVQHSTRKGKQSVLVERYV